MKKYFIKGLLIASTITLVITSCQKNKGNQEIKTETKTTKTAMLHTTTEIPSDAFITNPEDLLDQKVNFAIYHLTKAYTSILSNTILTNDLINRINNSSAKIYNLYDFADAHPEIDPIINNYFTNLLNSTTLINNRVFLNENLRYDMIYSPYAHIGNQEIYDINLSPIFASSTQMNPDINSEMEDYVPCWKLENGELKFMYINEEDLSVIKNPIIIIDNNIRESESLVYEKQNIIFVDLEDLPDAPPSNNGVVPEGLFPNIFATNKFRVNKEYKYEKGISGKIDFAIGGALSRSSQASDKASSTIVCKIKKNKLSTDITKYLEIFNQSRPDFPGSAFYYKSHILQQCWCAISTFERDPFASNKKLASLNEANPSNTCGTSYDFKGQRNYFGDWYSFDPNTNIGYELNFYHPFLSTSQTWSNAKGFINVYNPQ